MIDQLKGWAIPLALLAVAVLVVVVGDSSFGWRRPPLWDSLISVPCFVIFFWGLIELYKDNHES